MSTPLESAITLGECLVTGEMGEGTGPRVSRSSWEGSVGKSGMCGQSPYLLGTDTFDWVLRINTINPHIFVLCTKGRLVGCPSECSTVRGSPVGL